MRATSAMGTALLLAVASSLLASRAAADPTVSGFTPDHGPPGTLVKIIGADLEGLVSVEFGGIEATSFRVVAGNHVKATVPDQAMTGPIRLQTASGTARSAKSFVVEVDMVEAALSLAPPWPNPARGSVTFRFTLPRPVRARIFIHDAQGRRVLHLMDEQLPAGTHERRWDGRDGDGRAARPGVYVALLETRDRKVGRLFFLAR